MNVKDILRRGVRYIIMGVPKITVNISVGQIDNEQLLKGKNILITGGGSGIGFAIAQKCINSGANVIITGRNEEKLVLAVETLGDRSSYIKQDVSDINSIPQTINSAKVMSVSGDIDVLVCNAGVSFHEENIEHVNKEAFEKQFAINLEGAYFLAQEFVMKRNDKKEYTILFVSSERGFQCDDVPYGLSKASINSLVRGLSRRYYMKGIRVNGIAPGITLSEMTASTVSSDNFYAERLASKRYFRPEEVAEVAAFLISDASKCVSGEIVACDAGEYISSYF